MLAVCIPTLNEAKTIGAICKAIAKNLLNQKISTPTGASVEVSELLVVDGGSTDKTVEIAHKAGAVVVGPPKQTGKGAALYESLLKTKSEIVVWCDGDLENFEPAIIEKLATPLIENETTMMVKGFYENRMLDGKDGGGRTTWLMARPLLSLLFPELAHIKEPLSGEYAIRRNAGEQVPFVCGYGVEIGLLINISNIFGVESIDEVNLGTRTHRNRPLNELSVQAAEILQTALIKKARVKKLEIKKSPDDTEALTTKTMSEEIGDTESDLMQLNLSKSQISKFKMRYPVFQKSTNQELEQKPSSQNLTPHNKEFQSKEIAFLELPPIKST